MSHDQKPLHGYRRTSAARLGARALIGSVAVSAALLTANVSAADDGAIGTPGFSFNTTGNVTMHQALVVPIFWDGNGSPSGAMKTPSSSGRRKSRTRCRRSYRPPPFCRVYANT